ncbi:MAG: hypothetical protein EBR92_02570 [Alphaproteobacteria bacterium]|nr:hypothetical protein [Alphaproteobacteria bacterium]
MLRLKLSRPICLTLRERACMTNWSSAIDRDRQPGRYGADGDVSLLRVEPLKWWLVSPAPVATPLSVASGVGAVLDILDARCWITVTGPRAATLLGHCLPLDLRPAAFADDAVVSSAIHHVGVTLWRADDGFNLLVPRSYAASLWQLLFRLAQQYGVDVR